MTEWDEMTAIERAAASLLMVLSIGLVVYIIFLFVTRWSPGSQANTDAIPAWLLLLLLAGD